MKVKQSILTSFFALLLLTVVIVACKRETSSTPLVLEKVSNTATVYFKSNASFSIFSKALEITKLNEVLNLYGTMTVFAPTDEAFKEYFKKKNVAGLDQLNLDSLSNIIKYHIYPQAYSSDLFVSGSLPTPTVEGSFIRMDISQGLKSVKLNKTALVGAMNIKVTNGLVHEVLGVLEPPTQTLGAWVKSNPQYSIMAEAFAKTGVDTAILNKVLLEAQANKSGQFPRKWNTLFLETDAVLNKSQIFSFDDLAKKFSKTYNTTKDYRNVADSLNIFMRYHIIPQSLYVSNMRSNVLETSSPKDYMIFQATTGVTINKRTNYEVKLDLDNSGIATRNGVVNAIDNVLNVYNPVPVERYFYIGGEAEDRIITLPDGSQTTIQDQFYNWRTNPEMQKLVPTLKWDFDATTPTQFYYGQCGTDYCFRVLNSTRPYWIELTTKVIFKGVYDLYVVGRESGGGAIYFSWDDKILGGVLPDYSSYTNPWTEKGFDHADGCSQRVMRLGTVTLKENGTHKFKINTVTPATSMYYYKIYLKPK